VEPPARFRRSLFGYSPKRVRAFIAAHPEPEAPPHAPEQQGLEDDLRDLEEELGAAQAELAEQAASQRSAEAVAREAQDHAREAEQRVGGLEADLRRAAERFEARGADLGAVEEQAEVLTLKLDALRTALTGEIQKVWDAELRVHQVGTELGATRETLRLTEQELAAERARAHEAEERAEVAERDAERRNDPWTADELAPVFDMAERTVTRILAEARRRGDEELRGVQDEVARLRSETRRLEAWRDRVEPLVVPVQRSVEQARVEAERVGGLIRQALEPMTSAVTTLGERLVDLAEAASAGEAAPIPGSEAPPIDAGASETDLDVHSGGGPPEPVVDISDEPADSSSW
jgi:chromosome segregation ATPase